MVGIAVPEPALRHLLINSAAHSTSNRCDRDVIVDRVCSCARMLRSRVRFSVECVKKLNAMALRSDLPRREPPSTAEVRVRVIDYARV
jgi:hypothetical protein